MFSKLCTPAYEHQWKNQHKFDQAEHPLSWEHIGCVKKQKYHFHIKTHVKKLQVSNHLWKELFDDLWVVWQSNAMSKFLGSNHTHHLAVVINFVTDGFKIQVQHFDISLLSHFPLLLHMQLKWRLWGRFYDDDRGGGTETESKLSTPQAATKPGSTVSVSPKWSSAVQEDLLIRPHEEAHPGH